MKKRKVGRPSKYNPIYCQKIIDYFDIESSFYRDITITHKDGSTIDKSEEEAAPLPTFMKFARSIGTYHDTLSDWCKNYPDFRIAYNRCKELQFEFIVDNGLRGNYQGYFAGLYMKNMFGWRDKEEDKPLPQSINVFINNIIQKAGINDSKRETNSSNSESQARLN